MKLALLQENLKAALTTVLPAVATKSQPILETVKLSAEGGTLTLTATNLETTIIARCVAKVDVLGERCVPAKLLAELVGQLPNDRVTIEEMGSGALRLCCAHYDATLESRDASDFPTTPALHTTADVPLAFVRDVASLVAPIAATDDSRPALRGVMLRLSTVAEADAADGFRLARLGKELEGETIPAIAALIPAKTLQSAAKALKACETDMVRIGVTSADAGPFDAAGAFMLDAGDVQIITRLIEAAFPDVGRVIPTKYTTRIVVETDALQHAVAVAAIYAKRSSGVLKLQATPPENDMGPGMLVLSANAVSVGESTVALDAMVHGEPAHIALNAEYVAAGLACITTPQVAIELQTAQNPAVLRPVGIDGYVQVIMPMTVRG